MSNYKKVSFILLLSVYALTSFAQQKGSLFIIGGGTRSPELVQRMVNSADLKPTDYIVILPMATSEPIESITYISEQIQAFSKHKITAFNFTKDQADTKKDWIDSVRNARLIYVTGGDQNKFMDVVRGTKLYDAMHSAFRDGATIAGTSAGAAIMSQVMITGDQRENSNSIQTVSKDNIITTSGMGFLQSAIIDQHFIIRSRYNRLLSVLVDNPTKTLIGVDEGTALIVRGQEVQVVGDSQVLVVSRPQNIKVNKNKKVSFSDAQISLFTNGEYFKIKK
ncbi:cyanophycinase [Sphingobacterium rhinopitheci]|uniref:cyanophycinase n=1 Tax=Sphingobacterium rhinopitheci TaxID=2781960 RepID=UPI001F523CD0|nr:cyanophycinase [Sphingobacterium rhinopitheci]MCI0922207.1 cyanophycinase [Sphingobacterium rhinopitheci]